MNDLQQFNYGLQGVRTLCKDNEVWFMASDVLKILGIGLSQLRRLDSYEKTKLRLKQATSSNRKVNFINEAGLYSLILGSRKPKAKEFKLWVTCEVLPSIRHYGAYMTKEKLSEVSDDPVALKILIAELSEKVSSYEAFFDAEGLITMSTFGINCLDGLSAQGVRKLLQKNGILSTKKADGAWQPINKYSSWFYSSPFFKVNEEGNKELKNCNLKIKVTAISDLLAVIKS